MNTGKGCPLIVPFIFAAGSLLFSASGDFPLAMLVLASEQSKFTITVLGSVREDRQALHNLTKHTIKQSLFYSSETSILVRVLLV